MSVYLRPSRLLGPRIGSRGRVRWSIGPRWLRLHTGGGYRSGCEHRGGVCVALSRLPPQPQAEAAVSESAPSGPERGGALRCAASWPRSRREHAVIMYGCHPDVSWALCRSSSRMLTRAICPGQKGCAARDSNPEPAD